MQSETLTPVPATDRDFIGISEAMRRLMVTRQAVISLAERGLIGAYRPPIGRMRLNAKDVERVRLESTRPARTESLTA